MRAECVLCFVVLVAACARSNSEGLLVQNRVWVISSADPQELQATVDAAAPGDEIRIGNATTLYALGGRVGKGITIRGPGRIRPDCDLEPPATEPIRFVDVGFEIFSPTPFANVFRLDVLAGRVSFDSCRLHALRVRAGEVMMNASTTDGSGLVVDAARVAAVDSTFFGRREFNQSGPSAFSNPGIQLNAGARLQLSRCRSAAEWQRPGLLAEAGASAWLVDSRFEGGTDAAGIVNNATAALRAARCDVIAGGTASPVVGPVDLAAPLLGISIAPTLLASGATVAVRVTGVPGEPVTLRAGTELAVVDVPGVEQPQWLAGPTSVIAQGSIGAAGEVVFPVPLPLASVRLWLQANGGAASALQFSAPAGGLVR
ncbi:MAG: hypothetical protein MUC36_24035 [Planctomycetes bacterium]|jgi:hypothetical protein|nr:hypothetical protein [Planctomycetota bacterium]